MRLIFMGTPAFALPSLRILAQSPFGPALVVTRPDRPRGRQQRLSPPEVKVEAEALNLEVWQPENLREESCLDRFREAGPDMIVVVAYGQILPQELLALPPLGCVNLHASLLPRYRGAAPIQRALMAGEKVAGVTTMLMGRGLDTGDMILQAALPVPPGADAGKLHDQLAELGALLLLETVCLLGEGRAPRRPQRGELATYAPSLRREEERISWEKYPRQLSCQVAGLNPSPGAYTLFRGRKLKVRRLEPSSFRPAGPPGTVLGVVSGRGPEVACGRGSVTLLEVQPEGKRPMLATDFIQGYKLAKGEVLGKEG